MLILTGFYVFERAKERRNADPLFEFSQLEHPSFRYGLQTTMVLAMGQFGFLLVIPVLLQDGQHFTALRTGMYMVPMGCASRWARRSAAAAPGSSVRRASCASASCSRRSGWPWWR